MTDLALPLPVAGDAERPGGVDTATIVGTSKLGSGVGDAESTIPIQTSA
jgi:hypothetical protein